MIRKNTAVAQFSILALSAMLYCGPAQAIEADQSSEEIPNIVVVATKTPSRAEDLAGTVVVFKADDFLDQIGAHSADIVRYEPAISFPRSSTRFNWSSFNIRGVGGNRVSVELDGVPLTDQFAIGNFSNADRDIVDPVLIKRSEILFGPASSLYGSDALGGVVAYQSFNPSDLSQDNQPYISVSSRYRSEQNFWGHSMLGAIAQKNYGLLGACSIRDGEQRDASASSKEDLDWQRWDSQSGHAKWVWDIDADQSFTLGGDFARRNNRSKLTSMLGQGRFSSTTLLTGDDDSKRQSTYLNYSVIGDEAEQLNTRIIAYQQHTDTDQFTREERAGSDIRRDRWFSFRSEISGAKLHSIKRITLSQTQHKLSFGIDWQKKDLLELRDATQTTLDGAMPNKEILGELFPVRDFPQSLVYQRAIYLQDEIQFMGGDWRLIPALRFDDYRMQPRPDAIYHEDNPETLVTAIDDQRLSPKLGFNFKTASALIIFGQYAQGFRAPPAEDANIGLDIPLFNIRALPNPNLKSETSKGLELGLRRVSPLGQWSLSAHKTFFDDFIESKARIGTDPDSGTLLFQSRNIDKAQIWGLDLRWQQALSSWSDGSDQFNASMALAWTRGSNQSDGTPLNSTDPAQLVLQLEWQSAVRPLEVGLSATVSDAKHDINDPDDALFGSAGYAVFDVNAKYQFSDHLVARAGIFNIFNKTYWQWSSVNGVDADDPTLPLLSEPGRSAGLSFSLQL